MGYRALNNIEDISLAEPMNGPVGITQAELETNFKLELDALAIKFEIGYEKLLEETKYWYNGYSWTGKHTLYNPFLFFFCSSNSILFVYSGFHILLNISDLSACNLDKSAFNWFENNPIRFTKAALAIARAAFLFWSGANSLA